MVGCARLESTLQLFNHISYRRGLTWLNKQLVGTLWFYGRMDVTLMGRRTFAEVAKLDGPASAYPTTENFVFTHNALDCQGFTAVAEDPAEFVEKLGSDRSIWVVGGNTVLKPLLERDMVDHLIIQVAPVLLGEGIPLFTQTEALHRFKLEAVNHYGQFAELVYAH